MKTLITCDGVFELLTAGPVVKGSADAAAIQDHIANCESCRELAEALRPASHLIHEAMPLELRTGLPGYLAEDAAVSNVMSRITTLPVSRVGRGDYGRAVVGLGVTAAILLLLIWQQLPADNRHMVTASVSLDSMRLPHACFRIASGEVSVQHSKPSADLRLSAYECCTTCHASTLESSPQVNDMSRLVAACGNCH